MVEGPRLTRSRWAHGMPSSWNGFQMPRKWRVVAKGTEYSTQVWTRQGTRVDLYDKDADHLTVRT